VETNNQNSNDASSANLSFCTNCGAALTAHAGARFCGMCGAGISASETLAPSKMKSRQIFMIMGLALLVFIPVVFFTQWKTGVIPTDSVTQSMKANEEPFALPDKYRAVQDAAIKAPTDIKAQNEYAAVLVELLRESEQPAQGLILEAVEQLSRILAINPLEPDALLSLADISFNQQIFSKAAELYQRFLALRPNDDDVRTRLGSSLMFQGEFDRSIEQQKMVLAKNPKNFQAQAYFAVALGQKGEIAEARKAGKKALELAPNEEAKTRLTMFMESLDKKKEGETAANKEAKSNLAPSAPQGRQETGAVVPENKTAGQSSGILENALRNNPVAGRKVASVKISGSIATVSMIDFPMQAMPPFAKTKFYSSLTEAAKSNDVKTIVFVDSKTGAELERKEF